MASKHNWTKEDAGNRGWIYTFAANDGKGAVVLNRLDEEIHKAPTYVEALAWANANMDKIDEPLSRTGLFAA